MLTIRLNHDQEKSIDWLAKTHNQSKSEFVRSLIDNAIGQMRNPAPVFQSIREFSKTITANKPIDIKALIEEDRR
ncbi:MAG: hypothetical protein ACKVN9_03005 [Methylophilaceae bacterium]